MTIGEFAALTAGQLSYRPNEQQQKVIEALSRFCSTARDAETASLDRVFVLNGYAGTGKTSLTSALVRALESVRVPTVLMAPTGRAAKVFSAYSGRAAYTIHRTIYRRLPDEHGAVLRDNRHNGTVFIVDEASMIGDAGLSGSGLLADLVQFVFGGTGNKLILLGDTAQLPPVGCDFSPAMDRDTLRGYGLTVTYATMTAIARQKKMSGILVNATRMRRAMKSDPMPQPEITTADDVVITDTLQLPEDIEKAYRADGINETILITRSNQRARDFNLAIRNQVLYLEERLAKGEHVLVAKNNYFWTRNNRAIDFIANGDVAVVDRVYGVERRYGMEYADVELTFPDRDNVSLHAKIILDTLVSDAPAMSAEQLQRLYDAMLGDPELFGADVPYEARQRAIYASPYWNALQIKYAYAVTCHKAQGGQWKHVFVDMTYISPDAVCLTFYRWLYTAVTRARSTLSIISVPEY